MTETMKKAVITGPKEIEIIDVEVPRPGPGQVLVKVLSIGICGSDLHYYAGDQIGDRDIEYPMSLGHEFAGNVVETGPGVTNVKPGDRVMAEPLVGCGGCEWCRAGRVNLCPESRFCGSPPVDGATSQYYLLQARQAVKIPDDMSYDSALMAEPLANLIHGFGMCRFERGDTACIIGCGPIGLLLLQLVRRAGASKVFVAEKVGYRLEHGRRLGADVCIDAARLETANEILAATDGRGVDLALEAAGNGDRPHLFYERPARTAIRATPDKVTQRGTDAPGMFFPDREQRHENGACPHLFRVIQHTITHEMGHAAGISGHCADSTCLMYQYSNNWSRDGHFCAGCRGALLIHNN